MVEAQEPTFLSARQEHRQADVIRVGPQFIACAGLHQQQGHREVARSFQRLTPLLLPFRAKAHVSGDGVEENLLARSLPCPAEETPTLPVLRRLDDPTLMTVLVHRPHCPPFIAVITVMTRCVPDRKSLHPCRGRSAGTDRRYD